MQKCMAIQFDDLIPYQNGLIYQTKAKELVSSGKISGVLLLLQHTPVITVGRGGGKDNILVSKEFLDSIGIEVCESDRGGNVTYHGPGQLVGYPVFDLSKFTKDAHWFYSRLEEVIIKTLAEFGIAASRKHEYPGVWVGDKKIAALGIHMIDWITTHGFAFNLCVNKEHFKLINPCGITAYGIASLDDFIGNCDYSFVVTTVKKMFNEIFDIELIDETPTVLQ